MNIYQPYEELADTPDMLHLKLSDARERMLFVVYRAVPIGLFLMVWYILQQESAQIPMGFNYVFIFTSAAAILLLFFRSYISEIKIAAGNIFMVQKTLAGIKQINIPTQDADFVILHVRRGKGGGAKFILHTKQKQKFTILHIPLVYLDDKHTALIAETLQQLLGVEIKKA
ncbi:MAG TPA: hypothetical protein VG738_06280 [Chitinophagaceae bacterium]|nr:hypothetical protein [Chitinophagaceae bacterium]